MKYMMYGKRRWLSFLIVSLKIKESYVAPSCPMSFSNNNDNDDMMKTSLPQVLGETFLLSWIHNVNKILKLTLWRYLWPRWKEDPLNIQLTEINSALISLIQSFIQHLLTLLGIEDHHGWDKSLFSRITDNHNTLVQTVIEAVTRWHGIMEKTGLY